ncbi:UNVERIFIED_CONTAM: hypothetical protein Sangu_3082900 [Sesamum angustifolium]|uniref:Uncharacterized protein n=1 Tax=Sesamum angustifolium TaxID=2727405 RepID=A0AAW2K7P6_9LAMI
MHGEPLSWYKWMFPNHQLSSWMRFFAHWSFVLAHRLLIITRLLFSSFANHGSIAEFQRELERLCNRVVGLPPEVVLNCFISVLRSDIQRELAVLQPFSISQAVGLAKLVEAEFLDARAS